MPTTGTLTKARIVEAVVETNVYTQQKAQETIEILHELWDMYTRARESASPLSANQTLTGKTMRCPDEFVDIEVSGEGKIFGSFVRTMFGKLYISQKSG